MHIIKIKRAGGPHLFSADRNSVAALIFVIILQFLTFLGAAQNKAVISGKLIDSGTNKPMQLATVSIFSAADTVLLGYRMSNEAGDFKVPGLPAGKLVRVLITYSGYAVYRKELQINPEVPELKLGEIRMIRDIRPLEEVLVIAERPPVIIRKDTIEFNATSFKTLPTALVEDLLKKLPGVQLDRDGNITVNGKRVNRILVDGKEFFGGDVRVATRNLPANLIDKVQVMNDNDEKEQNPDMSVAALGQVINLKLRKGVKKGWFGKVYGGTGTDEHYETGGIINLFRDTLQVSLISFSNDLNKAGFGFSDVNTLGGFKRSGVNSISTSGGGLSLNGISFGGTGEGIQQSTGAGLNMNTVFKKGATLNTQYFFGYLKDEINEINNRQQFLADSILTSKSDRSAVHRTESHRIGLGIKFRLDSITRFDFKPAITVSSRNASRHLNTFTENNKTGPLNRSSNTENEKGNDDRYMHTLAISRYYKKPGKSFVFYQLMNYDRLQSERINNVYNYFYPPDTTLLDQLRKRNQNRLLLNNTLTFVQPLSSSARLRLIYSANYLSSGDGIGTFIKPDLFSGYTQKDATLSSDIKRKTWHNNLSAGFGWTHKKVTVTPSLNLLRLDIIDFGIMAQSKTSRHNYYLLPGISVDWRELSSSYSVSVTAPGISDIQTVVDNTNPLYVFKGNPLLKPAVVHNLYLNFFKYIPAKLIFVNAYFSGTLSKNGIGISRNINSDGIQTVQPINANRVASFFTQFNINRQIKVNSKTQLTVAGGYYINFRKNFLLINAAGVYYKTAEVNPYIRGSVSFNDVFEWNLSLNKGFYNTYYSNDFLDLKTENYGVSTDIVLRWPKKIVWESSLDYRRNPGAAPGVKQSYGLLNLGLTYLFLKNDKGQLKFTVFDALKDNVAITRISTENYINDRQVNIIQQYFLLTFTYNIRDFKGGKAGGKQNLFIF